jgi:hypothetical protein
MNLGSDINTEETVRITVVLGLTFAIPQQGIDELWRRHSTRLIQGWPLPSAPSSQVASEMLHDAMYLKASDEFASTLAATVKDPAQLDQLLRINNSTDVQNKAAWNPNLSKSQRVKLPFTKAVATGNSPEAVVTRMFLEADVASCVSAFSDPALVQEMCALMMRVSSLVKASSPEVQERMLASVFPDAGPAFLSVLSSDDALMNHWVVRRLRGAILDELAASEPVVFQTLGESFAQSDRLIDPYCIEAVQAAIDAGVIDANHEFKLSAYSAARANVVCPEGSPLRRMAEIPTVKPKKTAPAKESVFDSDQDLYLAALAALDMGDAAARIAISAGNLSDEEFLELLPEADVDTVVDWAERRLAQQPLPGQVIDVIDTMPSSRQHEVMLEVARRPNPMEMQPELALCVPEATLLMLNERSAVFVASTAANALGESQAAWSLAIELLTQGWEPSVLELLRSVEALTLSV